MTKPVKNVAASPRAKLLEHTRQAKQIFNLCSTVGWESVFCFSWASPSAVNSLF
jgi:hypothetical protein